MNALNIKKKHVELVVFLILLLNFSVGPTIYTSVKTKLYGGTNSQELNLHLDNLTNEGKSYIDGLERVTYGGKQELKLWGWAFLNINNGLSPADYYRAIFLFSDSQSYKFEAWSVPRQGVEDHFQNLGLNLEKSGFSTTFQEDLILPGIYRIGILFQLTEGEEYFLLSDRVLEKTSNSIEIK